MARVPAKADFPLEQVRRYLEPGPVVLLTSSWQGEQDVMTMGWHLVMEFTPALIGCVIARGNHSRELIERSGECAINLPTRELADTVARIGNSSGTEIDKFQAFGLTTEPGEKVAAPLIRECHAQFECKVHDRRLVKDYDFFVLEVVRARAAKTPRDPRTLHYQGEGRFMVAGDSISRRRLFDQGKL
ncbi:flavin reductase family protein [Xylophilus rhododendri]|uniref:Flavin reductase family protein n=1 Tax=Xylophilus rhododendri TaxID=2697032 RepID=A0A857J7Z5_9BURK|nr:flavin reductase family protein [Xylophilus rhododendri]QHI99189.1 flavin reductase family protein [Xylophilus rhododendri]